MRSSLTQALTRSRREFQMLAQALWAVAATRIALRLLPLARVRRTVRWMLSAGKPLPSGRCCSEREVIRAVVSAGKHCPGSTCLAVALVGQAMLSRHGYTSRLRVGVRRG